MLKTSQTLQTPSVECLLKLWAQRYVLNFSSVSDRTLLLLANSSQGRTLTTNKLKDHVLDLNCQMAWIQTKTLYNYIGNILDLNEARRITQFAFRVYKKLLEVYQKHSLQEDAFPTETVESPLVPGLSVSQMKELVYALEPTLMVFQEQHQVSKDWRSLGFMTTQLNFSNSLILNKLTSVEQVLLSPYLKFIEEQVSSPWQRVCNAAAKYELDSPTLIIVEQLFPAAEEIAQAVYKRLAHLLPNHHSRRGALSDPGIAHSCIRDLTMFQSYLWLCFLQGTLSPIEQELLPLCVMVVEGVEIKWELTQKWCQVLADEIIRRVDSEQKALLLPYTQGMHEIFLKQRRRLGFSEENSVDTVGSNSTGNGFSQMI
ncbi:hypothetical protein G7B40_033935 [Aetokthonos hydrillicola Thurmond2011]|jgi:hypothetical protein|uniref:Uncharacterized protein n=1 Tax=Aetokthonos hydrillicola Thurmond2011 TaxID=2712845 RepID=A0AAP5MDF8_9CYAN|nr:hypothetical protein [Aetokthonos hydrillicola]MBO3459752.1 hypothetical protein [Aetokthonos hydrillicola CCALA 1050]MBW4585185.1 hypothetical protein [Aetokthonos hydrillicola CCALA 1050]MDR9899523.1 hypothetical protein [Aetokthonos hydrillicola Thurmond2011]